MPLNKPLNSVEKEKSNPANNKIEDIFEHEENNEPVTPEKIPDQIPEQQVERSRETEKIPETVEAKPEDSSKEQEMNQMQPAPTQTAPPITEPAPQQKSMELIKIENILSENLDELFLTMTPQQQMQFKQKGEETATKINELLQETKIKVKEIITLIREWLKIIPGVNKFFLEQEAKIKTDRLLNIREQKK